jgi:large subunit ribosomal protein L6
MSRIGKQPIIIPEGIQISIKDSIIEVSGSKGKLTENLVPNVNVEIKDKEVLVSVNKPEDKEQRSRWGLQRSLINNMVIGVSEGFSKQLEVNGVGYKVALQGKKMVLNVGYSHPVDYDLPEGIDAQVEKNLITISGSDKQLVGQVSAEIRAIKKPEPYKGKGIKYIDEVIRRKEGKIAKTGE